MVVTTYFYAVIFVYVTKAKPAARQGQKVADPERIRFRTAGPPRATVVKVARGGLAFFFLVRSLPATLATKGVSLMAHNGLFAAKPEGRPPVAAPAIALPKGSGTVSAGRAARRQSGRQHRFADGADCRFVRPCQLRPTTGVLLRFQRQQRAVRLWLESSLSQ